MLRTVLLVLAVASLIQPGVARAAFEAGEAVPVVTAGELKARPMADSFTMGPAPAGATATLISRVSNAAGTWWYAEVGGKKGWLNESALAAAEAAPAPQPAAAPAPPMATAPEPTPVPVVVPAAAAEPAPAAVAVAPPQDAPQKRKLTEAGSQELELDVEISKDKTSTTVSGTESTSLTSLALKYGYCVTDNHQFGLLAGYAKESDDFFGSFKTYAAGPFYTFNFPSPPSTVVPFFGLLAVVSRAEFGSDTADGQVLEANAGVRVFAGDDFSVNIGAYYAKSKLSDEGFEVKTTSTGLRVGLSGFLR